MRILLAHNHRASGKLLPGSSTVLCGGNARSRPIYRAQGDSKAEVTYLKLNIIRQPGGEDVCFAAEVAILTSNGHSVIKHCVHNKVINNMSGFDAALRTTWSRSVYREVRSLIRTHRPQVAHFNNTFPLISPAAYYAARSEGVPVVQTLHNFRLLCPNALFFRDGRVCEDCLGRSIPWPAVVHKCYRGSRRPPPLLRRC